MTTYPPNSQPGLLLSTNRSAPQPNPTGQGITGIYKEPVDSLELFTPGPAYGDGPGVVGDTVGDSLHHGGAQKAVYAYAREELDYWQDRLGLQFTDGSFGENLTSSGITWSQVLVDQPISLGSALLEVSVARQPCATFAARVGVPGWLKMITARGDTGAYFRVIKAGQVKPGDPFIFHDPPAHTITLKTAFLASMGHKESMAQLLAQDCYPDFYRQRFIKKLGLEADPLRS